MCRLRERVVDLSTILLSHVFEVGKASPSVFCKNLKGLLCVPFEHLLLEGYVVLLLSAPVGVTKRMEMLQISTTLYHFKD